MRDGRDEAFRERKDSVLGVPGREGQEVKPLAYEGRSIGVFTSGGDSQGIKLTTYFKVALPSGFFIAVPQGTVFPEQMVIHECVRRKS